MNCLNMQSAKTSSGRLHPAYESWPPCSAMALRHLYCYEIAACIVILLYWSTVIFYYMTGYHELTFMLLRILWNVIVFILAFLKPKTAGEQNAFIKEVFFLLLMTFFGAASSVMNHNAAITGYLFNTLSSGGIAVAMRRFRMRRWVPNTLFFLFLAGFLWYMAAHHAIMDDFFQASDTSRNYISVMILTLTALVYISARTQTYRHIYLYAAAVLFVCILSVGRGGILAAFLLVLANIYVWMKSSGNALGFVIKGAAVFFVAISALVFASSIGALDFLIGGFASGGMNSLVRTEEIWKPYLELLNHPVPFVFGAYFIEAAGQFGHLHNSYLMLHARFGIVFLMILMFCLAGSFCKLIRKKEYLLAFFLVIYLLRAFTDSMLGFSYCDAVLLYFVFEIIETGESSV